jgi:hypothetical protein
MPTNRNQPAADVFARHGFARTMDTVDGTAWELDLGRHPISPPEWLEVQVTQ